MALPVILLKAKKGIDTARKAKAIKGTVSDLNNDDRTFFQKYKVPILMAVTPASFLFGFILICFLTVVAVPQMIYGVTLGAGGGTSSGNGSSTGAMGSGAWPIRDTAPTANDPVFANELLSYNRGQCVWYAKGRAIEIVRYLQENGSFFSSEQAEHIVDLLKEGYGNGGEIYDNTRGVFNGSSNIREPKAGSYIVWKQPGRWGHVGIVEEVTDTTITLTEGWSTGGGNYSCEYDWNCVHFEGPNTYELEDFYSGYGAHRDGSYVFSGYVYFLEPLV